MSTARGPKPGRAVRPRTRAAAEGRARGTVGKAGAGKTRAGRREAAKKTAGPAKPARRPAEARRAPSRPVGPPAFPQRAEATRKQLLLFDLVRARAAFHAAIQGMTAATADQPLGEGRWSTRQHAIHLCHRDRLCARWVQEAVRGALPPWHGYTLEQIDRMNAEGLALLGHLTWDQTLRDLQGSRQALLAAVESVDEAPAEIWQSAHPFGAMLADLGRNDRLNAEIIKRWRAERGA